MIFRRRKPVALLPGEHSWRAAASSAPDEALDAAVDADVWLLRHAYELDNDALIDLAEALRALQGTQQDVLTVCRAKWAPEKPPAAGADGGYRSGRRNYSKAR